VSFLTEIRARDFEGAETQWQKCSRAFRSGRHYFYFRAVYLTNRKRGANLMQVPRHGKLSANVCSSERMCKVILWSPFSFASRKFNHAMM
jgi:hypothetical protein